jgi:alpha-tubulin suppressor-like RCC1 family protein
VNGELGIGSATLAEPEPKLVGSGYAHVSVGAEHTCGLRNDGALECWGHNESLQVGVPAGVTIATPMRPGCDSANAGDRCFSDWTRVGVGAFHSCAIRQSRRMYCWGSNRDGQLGIGPSLGSEDTVEPQLVVGDTQWSDVSGGSHHSCGLDLDGTLHCWGKNESRQLGIADVGFVSTPARVEVYAPAGFRSLSLGENHSCAIRDDRTLWCWGRNVEGQIGIGAKSDMPVEQPTRVCF